MDGVEDPFLISAPKGSQEVALGPVSCEPVDHHFPWDVLQADFQGGDILRKIDDRDTSCLPF